MRDHLGLSIHPEVKEDYKQVAEELNCSVSFLQEFLLHEFLTGVKRS